MAYVRIEGEKARLLREAEAAASVEVEEGNESWRFSWDDGTDHWLYETGMVKHLGTDAVFFDTEQRQWLVFTGDAVGIVNEKDMWDVDPPGPA